MLIEPTPEKLKKQHFFKSDLTPKAEDPVIKLPLETVPEQEKKEKPVQTKGIRISCNGSIEINHQKTKTQARRVHQRTFDYFVDDILDVDIYNRFDVYYLIKIKAETDEQGSKQKNRRPSLN